MKTQIEVDTTDIKTRKADARGRVNLGPEFADREVEVLIVDHDGEETREKAEAN